MSAKKRADGKIVIAPYRPAANYGLDLEIFPASVLQRKASVAYLRIAKRIEFHLLIFVTGGQCSIMVDFESIACKRGSLLMLQPGQVHRFDATATWNGWIVIFRPEFLEPKETTIPIGEWEIFQQLDELPMALVLNASEQQAVAESVTRMFQDAQLNASAGIRHALLRNQLHALLIRLHLVQGRRSKTAHIAPVLLQRFKQYRLAVERDFPQRHRVADYAKRLGCSEKSLGRAVLEAAGQSAKAYLSQRIALEAKRLLAHTGLPISVIADRLGFDEATNFIKFFRREAGCAPGDFRSQYAGR
ncbi:MAG: AraC family transcriptional regulator [Gammaproteobacteria bacterium]|nr:AraC family transcriptional regulator [Gammaproteobacteria bacterium]